jgi:sorbitol/mannitol transport system substrate-binding protein
VDRRHRGGLLRDQPEGFSTVADKVGFALAPDNGLGKRGNWLWAWSLGIPSSSQKQEAAKTFIDWATNKDYLALVASKGRLGQRSPGHPHLAVRKPGIRQAAPFAKMTLDSINSADPTQPTVDPVPYTGVQFVAIPEFAGHRHRCGSGILGGSGRPEDRRRSAGRRSGAGHG